jgi:hypothetical protein
MIVDIRTYTLIPGQLGAFNKLYESEGYAIQTRHLGQPLGYHFIDIGPQNRIVHLWGYPDIATRAARRAEMEKDSDWVSYRTKSGALFQRQENKIMKHAPFYPAKMGTPKPYGIIDYRTYTAHPGKLAAFLQAYESEALAVQMKHLGNCLGWYMSDIGTQNEVVHMWGYADLNDRAARRNAMQADPAWAPYLTKGTSFLVNMENAILRPCPFFKPAV